MNSNTIWTELSVPVLTSLPRTVCLRSQSINAGHAFSSHKHNWHQLVYAITGTLTVTVGESWFVVPPEQAVWVPANTPHGVGSNYGAEFRSLYIAIPQAKPMPTTATILSVPPLLRELIREIAALPEESLDTSYSSRLMTLVLDQLPRLPKQLFSLPWPSHSALKRVCDGIYHAPDKPKNLSVWADELGMSARTLSRRFKNELGISFREWQQKLRVLKSLELLCQGISITTISLELGYSSTSSFSYMFKQEMGCSPSMYTQTK